MKNLTPDTMKVLIAVLLACMGALVASAMNIHAKGTFTSHDYNRISALEPSVAYHKGLNFLKEPSRPDSALVCFTVIVNKNEALFSGNSDQLTRLKIASYLNLGYLYQSYYFDFARAYSSYNKALDMARSIGSDYDVPYALIGMAGISEELGGDSGMVDAPEVLLKRAFPFVEKGTDEVMAGTLLINLISIALDRNDKTFAAREIESLSRFKFSPGEPLTPLIKDFINVYKAFSAEHYDVALEWLDHAAVIDPDATEYRELYNLFILEMKVFMLRIAGKTDRVPEVAEELLRRSLADNSQNYISRAYNILYEHYRDAGETFRAREYEYKYLHFTDSLRRASNVAGVRDIAFRGQLDKVNEEVRFLSAERRTHIAIISAVSIVALVVSLALVYFIITKRRLRRANRVLYDSVQQQLRDAEERKLVLSNLPEPQQPSGNEPPADNAGEQTSRRLTTERLRSIYADVLTALDSPEIFSPDFSIKTLASLVGVPYYDVSEAINECSGSNFKALLTEQRITEACRRLKQPDALRDITMETFAENLGFKSRTYFATVFKKHTGLTPTQYIKIAREEQKNV